MIEGDCVSDGGRSAPASMSVASRFGLLFMEDDGDSTEESPGTQDIEDENSTMGKSSRMHATEESLAMKEDGGYVDTLMRVSLKLVCEEHPSEIRRHGLEILLHLLRFRWKEISISECGNCVDILKLAEKLPEPSTKLASKRAAATLVAEIAWSHGVSLLRDLILRLVSLFEEGACEDELVCFILRSISNVGITRNAHIEGDRGEMLVHGLGEFLPQILPLLCSDGHLLRNSPSELMNELVSKHVVGNCTDSYLWTVSSMLSRKLSSVYWKRENEQMFKFLHKLIMFKPYIKDAPQYSGYEPYDESVQELLENDSEEWPMLAGYNRKSALGLFCRILELWEPQFHPLIREGHKDVLIEIASQLTFGEYIDFLQPFQPDSADFLLHLQPYVQNYIDDKNKNSGYDKAKEQAILHREFDVHLASGALDPYVRQVSSSKGDFARNILEDDNLCDQFLDLDHDLLKMSLKRRAKLLNEQDRLCLYFKCMEIVAANEQLRSGLESLMFELEAEGFFCADDDSIEWGKKRFSELVDTFDKDVFDGFHLPKYYVVRGIMDLRQMLLKKDRTLEEAFEVVVGGAYHKWMGNLHLFWMDTRYYEHADYDIIKDPIKKVWKKMED